MQRILSNSQMREADLYTIEKLGVSQEELVLRAGKAVAEEINRRFMGGRVLVCIGSGNNGADGEVVAKELNKIHGFAVDVVFVRNGIFQKFNNKYDIIVDCIFGTGLNRPVEGKYKTAIELINSSGAFVVSCDIPSGLNGDTGLPMGVCVKANLTIAIQEFKLGHFLNDGPDYCGVVVSKDIGISIWGECYPYRITNSTAKVFFQNKLRNVNKGDFGKAVVIGGSKTFPGSVMLSNNALTSLKMGIGYSAIAIPSSLISCYANVNPENVVISIKDNGGYIKFDKKTLSKLLNYNAIAIGMGIGVSKSVYKSIKFLLENYTGNLIIDADGLNTLSKYGIEVLKNRKCRVVLTPHVKEFSRLYNVDKQEIISNGISLAKQFAYEYQVALVLKNACSIITDGENVVLNTTGCCGLAKGGSGDVLSGVLAGILARTDEFFDGVCVAPYIFGLAGEMTQKEQNEYTMVATDVINNLYKVINEIRD